MSSPEANLPKQRPTAVDLFCGCGAVTEGLKTAGFNVLAALDYDRIACETYRSNHPSAHLIERDIRQVDPQHLKEIVINHCPIDLMVVCAPCQPFSSQHRYSGQDDRMRLILESIRFAETLNPRLILFENVPGLAAGRFDDIRRNLEEGLKIQGYLIGNPKRLNAADFGVPQRRIRYIMLAAKEKKPPELPDQMSGLAPTSVRSAIGDLHPLQSGEADPNDTLHFARNHHSVTIKRLKHIPKDGGSRSNLPTDLQLRCHIDHKGHPDVYGRMRWDDVAPTLTTGCTDLTRGRFAHPRDDRAVTLREAARLQTFPDKYRFSGSAKDIATQIGNAVPVQMVQQLAPILQSASTTF